LILNRVVEHDCDHLFLVAFVLIYQRGNCEQMRNVRNGRSLAVLLRAQVVREFQSFTETSRLWHRLIPRKTKRHPFAAVAPAAEGIGAV
jgi:hypothetical protein